VRYFDSSIFPAALGGTRPMWKYWLRGTCPSAMPA
jgi:hypothetical protein